RPQSGGDLRAALAAERAAPAPTDPEQAAKDAERAAAAAAKRALATQRAIRGALGELELWLTDQLRAGLAATMGELTERCRAIAARLVDGKATSLAGRVDEIPARILALPTEERAEALVREFGKLALLIRAWRASPDTPELRRAVGSAESRDALLSDGAAPLVRARWEVLGEQINTRRDGLVAQSTWLLNLSESADQPENAPPLFAQLLDFYPAHLGRRGGAFAPGDRFEATLAFYPAAQPLRAVIAERSAADSGVDESEGEGEGEGLGEGDGRQWPAAPMGDPLAGYAALQLAAPWTLSGPILLPAGGFARAADHSAWWLAEGEAGHALPLEAAPRPALFGLRYSAMAAIWTGARLQPLAAISDWGRVSLQDGAS
ncbi:MAG: SWIM zinc finger family protein, partial [Pseudomonadota bacterium]